MSSEQPRPAVADPPATFSLRTMFLFVTYFAIVCAGFRFAGLPNGFWFAPLFLAGFLFIWFFATGRGRTAVRVLIGLVGVILLVSPLLLPRVGSGPVSPRVECQFNLQQIGIALQEYHKKYGSFPPAYVADAHGKPLYSWRVEILPFMDHDAVYRLFHLDQPWDSPANSKISRMQTTMYYCPSEPREQFTEATTEYVAVVGPTTAWPSEKGSRLADFKDPSKTILVVEVANAGIHWAKPRDLYFGQMAAGVNPKSGQGISSEHKGGVNAVFADGHVELIPDDIDPKQLARMLEINPSDEAGK